MMAKLVGKRINIGISSDLDDRLNKISQMYGCLLYTSPSPRDCS